MVKDNDNLIPLFLSDNRKIEDLLEAGTRCLGLLTVSLFVLSYLPFFLIYAVIITFLYLWSSCPICAQLNVVSSDKGYLHV